MSVAVVSPIRLLLCLSLLLLVEGLLQCPDPPGWQIIDDDGGTGGRWKIPGDVTLERTQLKLEDGSNNGTWTHLGLNFTLTSAFDSTELPCYGETITDTPGNYTNSNPGKGFVNGTCEYTGSAMGSVATTFEYNLDFNIADMYFYQDFTCNRTTNGRPWRVHADCINKRIDVFCDDDGVTCSSPYPFDFGVYYVPLFPPPPLTNCSAGVLDKHVDFIVTNISYNSVQSSEMAPVLGAAYVELSIPLIDFTMRCLPNGDEMAWTYNGTSDTWYDCKADFTNPVDMPATWVKFNHTTFEVTVQQEFSCDDSDAPQYVTASGASLIPKDCAETYNGQECWSTEVVNIKASNITQSTTKPVAHAMPLNKVSQIGSSSNPEYQRLILELLEKANVLHREHIKPNLLPGLLGNPQ